MRDSASAPTLCWLVFLSLTQTRETWKEGTSTDIWGGGSVFLILNWWRSVQPTVGGATAGQVLLGSIRKVGELELLKRPSFKVFSSCSELLPWFSSVMDCNLFDEINTFLPSYFWSVFYHSNRKPN